MVKLSVSKAAEMCGGKVMAPGMYDLHDDGGRSPFDDMFINGVATDSRQAVEGTVFVALKGENGDGHDYISGAYGCGARVFMIHDLEKILFLGLPGDAVFILVEDTLKGLQKLSKEYIKERNIIRLAVTGSTGKTSTKELLYAVFSQKYKTVKNKGNFNNHLGVPLTSFLIDDDTEAAIFEMGMNNPGEIDLLAGIVRPETALITNVGVSHIGNLGTRENILKAKLEITGYMGESDTVIINGDNDMLQTVGELPCGIVRAGTDISFDVVISDVEDRGADGISFRLTSKDGESEVMTINAPGAHNAWNGALAAACGLRYGISLKEAKEGFKNFAHEGKRLNIIKNEKNTVIDDSYNASPDSMKAAVDVLMRTPVTSKNGRRIAALANMYELGENSSEYHRETGMYAAEAGVDVIIGVGEEAMSIVIGAVEAGKCDVMHFMTRDELAENIADIVKYGDVILIKGSRATGMDKLVDVISAL